VCQRGEALLGIADSRCKRELMALKAVRFQLDDGSRCVALDVKRVDGWILNGNEQKCSSVEVSDSNRSRNVDRDESSELIYICVEVLDSKVRS
jgi:hypothetical protein